MNDLFNCFIISWSKICQTCLKLNIFLSIITIANLFCRIANNLNETFKFYIHCPGLEWQKEWHGRFCCLLPCSECLCLQEEPKWVWTNAIVDATGHVVFLHSVFTGPGWDALIATPTAAVMFMGKPVFFFGVGIEKWSICNFGEDNL